MEQVVIGLAKGLSGLPAGSEQYLFLAYSDADDWLRPYVSGSARIVHHGSAAGLRIRRRVRAAVPSLAQVWDWSHSKFESRSIRLKHSDGIAERLGAGVVHFPTQQAYVTDIPSIYHPHDLQHLHLPELFSRGARRYREATYRAFCRQAHIVAVSSQWVRQDLIHHYGLSSEKVQVIRLAPPTEIYPEPTFEARHNLYRRYRFPVDFALYAAQTWPHKNHIGLLEALSFLKRERQLDVPLVCTGRQNEFYPEIKRRLKQLGLERNVQFLGYVAGSELYTLYRMCRMVVIPTRFEAGSFPMWEAFHAGVPVACSNVTSLPEQANGAAVLFDPSDSAEMAEAIARVWTDRSLRYELVRCGRNQIRQLSWDRTARTFRAWYRKIAGRTLTPEDYELLG